MYVWFWQTLLTAPPNHYANTTRTWYTSSWPLGESTSSSIVWPPKGLKGHRDSVARTGAAARAGREKEKAGSCVG